jgi:hypothetical protein
MILFKLRCDAEHEFEGWFKDGATYERQRARSQISCPECSSSAIEKAPMAPRLGRTKSEPAPQRPPSPAEIRRKLQELRRAVEVSCEHVGERFAEEARAIHRGEAEERGIYGEASEAETEALADEGIEVARIPWVPSNDA